MRALGLILVSSLVTTSAVAQSLCPQPAAEYCTSGCEDLGNWVVVPADSWDHAVSTMSSLDDMERVSAFIAQTPLGHVVIRRERHSKPAAETDMTKAHWRIQEYADPLSAAVDALQKGGWIFSTNGSHAHAVRIWWVQCGEEPTRRRAVR
jgi:hypothetical protein